MFNKCKVCESKVHEENRKLSLVKCNKCSLVFCKKKYSDLEIISTYDKLYNTTNQYRTHQREYQKLKDNQRVKIGFSKKNILNFLLNEGLTTICEIGAGVGIVASYLRDYPINYVGIEIDSKTVEKSHRIGLNIKKGAFTEMNKLNFKSDAIIAFEVIEHLQDLDLFFKLSKNHLTSNGYIGFTVPNYNKRLNYSENYKEKIFQSGPPIHLNFFTKESIFNISEYYGFSVEFYKEKKFPYFNYKLFSTYKFIVKSLFGKYHGSTLQCVLKKK